MELTIDRRYRGPLTSANGGYACGRLAAYVDADEVEVTLRLPPPLDRPLAVERDGELVRLLDGDALVAEARPAPVDVDPPPPVSLEEADAARDRHVRGGGSDFGECFVCGTRADGLQIHVGPVAGREPLHAAPVVLDRARARARLGRDRLPRRLRRRRGGPRRRRPRSHDRARRPRAAAGSDVRRRLVAARRGRAEALRGHRALRRGRRAARAREAGLDRAATSRERLG